MGRETLTRLGRRAVVVVATLAILGLAAVTVQTAAEWREAAAPLDAAPAGMTSISDEFAFETGRADDLARQVDGVASQIAELQSALIAANGSVDDDTAAAVELQAQLAAANAKLTGMQKQLKAAQQRLEQLNRAAARQAALNRAAGQAGNGGGTREAEDHEDDEDDEEEDDD